MRELLQATNFTIRQIIRHNPYFFGMYFLFLFIGAFLLFRYTPGEIFWYVNQNNYVYWDLFFSFFTHVGDGLASVIIAVVLLFWRVRLGFIAATAFLLVGIIIQLLKKVVFSEHMRPYVYFHEEEALHIIDGVRINLYHTFPSGHTATGFCIFALLAFFAPQKKWGILFFLLAFLVGYSRIYLVQHFFYDIYIGSIFGVGCAVIVFWFFELQKNKPFENLKWMNKPLFGRKEEIK